MPGGRPRKYADKAAATAAGKLRAAERRVERKAAKDSHGGLGIKAEGGYRFILEDIVCLRHVSSIYIFHVVVSSANIIDRVSGQLPAGHHTHLSASLQAL